MEVDETLLGGLEEGVRGRQTESKVLLAVAAQENGAGIGRVRMRSIPNASELLPRVHRVVSLLKRWLLGTHQGGVSPQHLVYYLDEFTFRSNRPLAQPRQAVLPAGSASGRGRVAPAPYKSLVSGSKDDF